MHRVIGKGSFGKVNLATFPGTRNQERGCILPFSGATRFTGQANLFFLERVSFLEHDKVALCGRKGATEA